jgi:hypothetical protein
LAMMRAPSRQPASALSWMRSSLGVRDRGFPRRQRQGDAEQGGGAISPLDAGFARRFHPASCLTRPPRPLSTNASS